MQRKNRLGLSGAALAIVALSAAAVAPVSANPNPDLASRVHFMPLNGASGQAFGQARGGGKPGGGGSATATQAGINYHGGRVAAPTAGSAFHVVSIYWSATQIYTGGPSSSGTDLSGTSCVDGSLVGTFLNNLNDSAYYNINKTYWDNIGGSLRYVSGNVVYDGCWADGSNAPSGTQSVSDAAIRAEIVAGFSTGRLTYAADTIYSVFSAGGVNLGGQAFTQYCAYHGHFSWTDSTNHVQDVIYAVMPYNAYSTSCMGQAVGPNGDAADFEVNTLVHEIEEANTDPDLNAWYDRRGYENADKCAWTWGTTSTASNGAKYNVSLGGKNWLIQRNWKNAGSGSCAMS